MLVGMTRFERAKISCPQSRCLTKLGYIPLARTEGFEPPTHAALETTALPVELHPYRAAGGTRTRVDGFADRCLTTRPQPLESR